MKIIKCLVTGSILGLTLLIVACKNDFFPRSSIILVNNSDMDILYYCAFGGDEGVLYPDTTILQLTPPFPKALTGQSGYYYCNCTEEEIFAFLPSDTLSLYIFHPDTLAKYEWQKIAEDYNILKRYDLSLGDLQRLNFKVNYPPDTSMESVRMYPPE